MVSKVFHSLSIGYKELFVSVISSREFISIRGLEIKCDKVVDLLCNILLSILFESIFIARVVRLISKVNKTFLDVLDDIAAFLLKFYLVNSLDLSSLCLIILILLASKFSNNVSFSRNSTGRLTLFLRCRSS